MRLRVPFPYSRSYLKRHDEDAIRSAARASVERTIPLSILKATQRTVGTDRLRSYLEAGPSPLPSRDGRDGHTPLVIVDSHGAYLRNGHHRATRAAIQGERTIQGRIASMGRPPQKFRARGHAGELLLIRPEATAIEYREHDVQDVATVLDGGLAVVEIEGPLEQKPDGSWWSFFDDYESIACRYLNAIHSDEVRALLLKIDSPGGAAAGLNSAVDMMIKAKRETGKPVIVFADEGAYSAAMALACVGDEIYIPRAGGLGSIGVVSMLVDWTKANEKDGIRVEVITSGKRKADGNPNVPMSKQALKHVQRRVDGLAKLFFSLVKDSRGIDARPLEADTFYGKDAVRVGLADGIMSLDSVIRSIQESLDNGTLGESRSSVTAPSGAPSTGPERKGTPMSAIVKLTAKVQEATKAVASAAKGSAKDSALAALALAEAALGKELAKVTKDKKTTTVIHDSGSSSSSKSSEEEEESMSASSASSSGSSSKSSEEEEEEESAKMPPAAKELISQVHSITGAKDAKSALGALAAIVGNGKDAPAMSKRLAKLEARDAARKVDALIAKGREAGKITPGNEAKAREMAAKYGPKALAAFIDAAAPVAAIVDHEPEQIDGVTVSAEQKKILLKMGIPEKDLPRVAKAMATDQARAAARKGN